MRYRHQGGIGASVRTHHSNLKNKNPIFHQTYLNFCYTIVTAACARFLLRADVVDASGRGGRAAAPAAAANLCRAIGHCPSGFSRLTSPPGTAAIDCESCVLLRLAMWHMMCGKRQCRRWLVYVRRRAGASKYFPRSKCVIVSFLFIFPEYSFLFRHSHSTMRVCWYLFFYQRACVVWVTFCLVFSSPWTRLLLSWCFDW